MNHTISLFSFCYDAVLVVTFTAVAAMACCLNLIRRRNVAIPVIGLFSFYLLDTLIIFMTEAIPSFSAWYDTAFVYSPSLKTIVYLGIGFFTLFAWNVLTKSRFTVFQGMLLIALGLWLICIPLMQQGAMTSWLYFLAYQVFNVGICSYGLWKLKRLDPANYEGPFGWIRALLILTIIFSVFISIEDSIVIFNFDSYLAGDLYIYSRNISEDILRLIYTGFFFRLFAKQFRHSWMTAPEDRRFVREIVPDAPEPEAVPAAALSEETAADYKKLKFAQQLYLTEREMEVFTLMLDGMTNQQISDELHISTGTVKAHIHNIFQKAEVTHRYELLRQYDAFSPDKSG